MSYQPRIPSPNRGRWLGCVSSPPALRSAGLVLVVAFTSKHGPLRPSRMFCPPSHPSVRHCRWPHLWPRCCSDDVDIHTSGMWVHFLPRIAVDAPVLDDRPYEPNYAEHPRHLGIDGLQVLWQGPRCRGRQLRPITVPASNLDRAPKHPHTSRPNGLRHPPSQKI